MLSIPTETLGWIILKSREYEVKEGDSSDGDAQEDPSGVLQDRTDDPTAAELTSWIEDLTDTQQAELVALMWLGRGDAGAEDFAELVAQARRSRTRATSTYLLGAPLLSEYLEEGLSALGYDVAEIEAATG